MSSDCSEATIASGSTSATIIVTAPIGKTTITFTSPLFPLQQHKVVLNVYPPNLTCNDEVSVSLLNECTVALTPDMILGNPCMDDRFSYEVNFTDPNINDNNDVRVIGETLDGFPIVDFSGVPCGTSLAIKVKRITTVNCGTTIEEECSGNLIITDQVDPILIGEVDEDIIACYYATNDLLARLNAIPRDGRGATLTLKPTGVSVPTDRYDFPLVINPVSEVFSIQESCSANFTVSAWQEVAYDCTTNAFSGLIANADDPIRALMEIEVNGSPAIFKSYFRVVQAIDDCGNESNIAIQRVVVAQPDVVFPMPEIELPCGADIDPLALYKQWASDPDWYPEYGAFLPNFDPTPLDVNGDFSLFGGLDDTYFTDTSGDEVPLFPSDGACGYATDWQDSQPIYVCENSYKVFREWTVFNFCDGHLEIIDIIPQVIKVGDHEAPTLEYLGITSTGSPLYNCVAEAILQVDVKDKCSDDIRAFIDIQNDNIPEAEFELINNIITVSNVPIDQTLVFTIRLIDECGNSATYGPFTEILTDNIPPVAICETSRTVSLGLDCEVIVPATSFDDGSYDNCGAVTFSVARMDAVGEEIFNELFNTAFFEGDQDVFQPNVVFTKADLTEGCEGVVQVIFRVQDGSGNVNFCMTEVSLQDKIAPVIISKNITIPCDAPQADDFIQAAISAQPSQAVETLLNTPGAFSNASGAAYITVESDNCDNATFIVDAVDARKFDDTCRKGEFTITYQAIDACGNVSLPGTAKIIFQANSDWIMNFPLDAEVFCDGATGLPAAASLDEILTNYGCDTWGLEVTEENFESEGNACSQIVRTYHLINFCTWNPSNTETAVVERPQDLIINSLYTVALRYRDANRDGINDIDDGNEDADLEGDPTPSNPINIYKSAADRTTTFQPIRIPFTGSQLSRIADNDEANNFDPYDVTDEKFDADFVVIDRFDFAYQNIPVYEEVSQFSGIKEHYVSAQMYGNIQYRQVIRINDVTAPTIQITQNGPFCDINADDCTAPISVKFEITEACSNTIGLTYQLIAFTGTSDQLVLNTDPFGKLAVNNNQYTITGQYPIGKHKFLVRAVDGCTNSVITEIPFEVTDCAAPSIVCLYGLTIDLMPTGMVTIDAEDFDNHSLDNCSDVTFTFADPRLYPDSTTRTLSCARGELGFVVVELWGQDAAGNTAYCSTFINVQDNLQNNTMPDACPTAGAIIAGTVANTTGTMVSDVKLDLSGTATANGTTGNNGQYQFGSLQTGYDYTVTPQKDDNPLNGVSTLDLVMLSKHILGVETLNTPYQLIAADVNNSGSITTYDIVTLRKVILAIDTEFSNNTSWRFIPKDYQFNNPANPFEEDFPEVMNFNDLNSNYLKADFIAIKIGDLNGTAVANSSTSTETRTKPSTWYIRTENVQLKAGDLYTANFIADATDMEGYQFTMNLEGLEIVEILPSELSTENIATFDDAIAVSWNGESTKDLMFSVVVKATAPLNLRDAIRITSDKTAAEAYNISGEVQAVALNFVTNGYELAQNQPNPFQNETFIGFQLPTTSEVKLTLRDANGKTMKQYNGLYSAGYHKIKIESQQLPAGLIYYTLETQDFTATRKMVVIK